VSKIEHGGEMDVIDWMPNIAGSASRVVFFKMAGSRPKDWGRFVSTSAEGKRDGPFQYRTLLTVLSVAINLCPLQETLPANVRSQVEKAGRVIGS
jgi:hypothetical protein